MLPRPGAAAEIAHRCAEREEIDSKHGCERQRRVRQGTRHEAHTKKHSAVAGGGGGGKHNTHTVDRVHTAGRHMDMYSLKTQA